MTLTRRSLVTWSAASALALLAPRLARADEAADDITGITAGELKIGSTTSLSGPVSALGIQARCQAAFFKMINEGGGIAGRKITYIYYDDGFNPAKTAEQTRRLVEDDKVAILFNMLGTAPNSAVVTYINKKKVPHLFLSVNGDKWGDYKAHPWTMGFAPSARIEGHIYAKYALQQKPDARIAVLFQNDDLGKDYVAGVRDALGADFDKRVQTASHEVSDPTVDSQLVTLQATGAEVLLSGTTAKFAAQSIRRVYDLQWKAMHFIASGAASINGAINPAGPERAVGVISSAYVKDAGDPAWANDPGLAAYLAFMGKYFPEGNPKDGYNVYAYTVAQVLMTVLGQCDGTLTRSNIMHQAANLKDVEIATLLPGVRVNTSPTNYHPLRQMQLQRWEGAGWQRFGNVIEGTDL